MPKIRTSIQPKNKKVVNNSEQNLFAFSSILNEKYRKRRVVPTNVSSTSAKWAEIKTVSSDDPRSRGGIQFSIKTIGNKTEYDRSLFTFSSILSSRYGKSGRIPKTATTDSEKLSERKRIPSNVFDIGENYQSYAQWSTTDETYHIDNDLKKEHSKNKKYPRCRRLRPYLIIIFAAIIAIILTVILLATLYKPLSTTTSKTTTTQTTATTTTSTTSTSTSTSTTSTSTTSTTTTETSTTTETTITTTTDTTTTTACYFGDDYVSLVEGGQRRIKNLKVGDRVWTISNDGKHLVEDEIYVIAHAVSNAPTYFYTFTTIEGHTVSMTDTHFMVVVSADNEKGRKSIRASQVRLHHQLIMVDRVIPLITIEYIERVGYYGSFTLSGYLLVNNLTTSVYIDGLSSTQDLYHRITGPFRVYYHITRWLFGNDYIPFEANVSEEMHPLSIFIMKHFESIRLFFIYFPSVMQIIFIILIIYLIQRYVLNGMNYYHVKMKCMTMLSLLRYY